MWCGLSALAFSLFAASPSNPPRSTPLAHRVWRTEDGLPQDYITAVRPTKDGFLWLGTQEGLARFDGLHFQIFDKGNEPALGNAIVIDIAEAPDGSLWVGTDNGGLARRSGGHFEAFGETEGMKTAHIWHLYVDCQGRLWVLTEDAGLFYFSEGRFHPFEGLPPKEIVSDVVSAPDGSLWIATASKGLFRYHEGKTLPIAALPPERLVQLLFDGSGALWGLGVHGSVWRHHPEEQGGEPGGLFRPIRDRHMGAIRAMTLDAKGQPWFRPKEGALLTWHEGGIRPVRTESPLPESLTALACDRAGNLWAGSMGQGLHMLRTSPISSFTERQGLADDMVLTVCEDAAGVMWAGGKDGRVTRIEGDRITIHGLPGKAHWIYSIFPRREGGVWVGTYGGSLHALDSEGRVIPPGIPVAGLPQNIFALVEEAGGTLWVGGLTGLVGVSNGVRRTVLDHHFCVTTLSLDTKGRLLIGALDHGLGMLNGDAVTFTGPKEGLLSAAVSSILPVDGHVLLGIAGGGLARLEQGKLSMWHTREGLWNDSPGTLLTDDQDRLWIGSNRGIFSIHRKDLLPGGRLVSIPYGREDGMFRSECNSLSSPSGWRARDGRLWFATTGGLAIVDPRKVPEHLAPSSILIERALSDGKEVSVLPQAILSKGRGRLTVHYLAPSLTDARRLVYRYRLEGFEKEWVEARSRREAFYTNLSPGKYVFKVEATFLGHEDECSQTAIEVVVPPAFYQTWWFMTLCVAGLGAMGWRVYHTRVRLVRLENALLTERNRIGMELHDHLSQLMTGQLLQMETAEMMMDLDQGPDRVRPFLTRAGQLAKEGIEETRRTIQNLRNVTPGHPSDGLPERLLRTILPLAEGTAVKVTFNQTGEAFPLPDPVIHACFRVGQEAVTNAIRHGHAKRIELILDYEPKGIRMSIKDQGQGFIAEGWEFAPEGGLGLKGMAQRIKELGGVLKIVSQPGEGATVEVSIPKKKRWFW